METGRAIGRVWRLAAPAIEFLARGLDDVKKITHWTLMVAIAVLAVASEGRDISDPSSQASVPELSIGYSALTAKAGGAVTLRALENATSAGPWSVSGLAPIPLA